MSVRRLEGVRLSTDQDHDSSEEWRDRPGVHAMLYVIWVVFLLSADGLFSAPIRYTMVSVCAVAAVCWSSAWLCSRSERTNRSASD